MKFIDHVEQKRYKVSHEMTPFRRSGKRRAKRVDVRKLGKSRSKAAHHAATLRAARLASSVNAEIIRLGIPSVTDRM